MTQRPSRSRRMAFVTGAVVLVALSFLRRGELQCDDAFITFRYAENLAAGHGLVWNAGERVEGYSNLLHTLLIALGCLAGASSILAANILGAAGGLALLLALPPMAEALGSNRGRGEAAAMALGLSASFQGWTSRGLETIPFAALLAWGLVFVCRALVPEPRPSLAAAAFFGLLGISRPEAMVYVGLAALALLMRRGWRAAAAFALPAVLPFAAQLAFRVWYYGEYLPNPYYLKLTGRALRWERGTDYVLSFRQSGLLLTAVLVAGAATCLVRRRTMAVGLVGACAAAGVGFAISTGGEFYPEWRFLTPVLPLFFLLASTMLDGRAGAAVALALVPLVALSPAGAMVRRTVRHAVLPALAASASARQHLDKRLEELTGPGNDAMSEAGRWMRKRLGPDGLIAIGDAGRIPFTSGLRAIDTVGLMDRHLARQPGPLRPDIGYVLGRNPDIVTVHLAGFWRGGLLDHMLVGNRRFLDRYRLERVAPVGGSSYFLFVRTDPRPCERYVDVTGWAGAGSAVAIDQGVPRPASDLVRPLYRHTGFKIPERQRLARLLRPDPAMAADVGRLDREIRAVAARTRQGILFVLPPGVTEVSLRARPRRPIAGPALFRARVELLGSAPDASVTAEVESLEARALAPLQGALALEIPAGTEPVELGLRVRRGGASASRVRVLLASPEIVALTNHPAGL